MSAVAKKVTIITLEKNVSTFYENVIESLFGNLVTISSFSVLDGSIKNIDETDLFVVTTDAFKSINEYKSSLPADIPKVELNVEFTKNDIETLMKVQKGTCAYFVNLSEIMVRECIARLSQLGINHIDFIPCYPGAKLTQNCDLAITVGESRYIPEMVKNIVDLGHRVPDSKTIVEMALRLKLEYLLERENFKEYFNTIASSNYSFNQIFDRSLNMESQFEILMEIIDAGIIGVNENNVVFACNSKAEEITGISKDQAIDKPVKLCFPFLPLTECRRTGKKITDRLIKFKGIDINITVAPVIRRNEYIGAFVTIQRFKEEESKQNNLRIQLLNKGHKAKYTFNDIKGESTAIKKACTIAKKMAKNNSSVLIIGESGTGKELFAHAIHNESDRKDNPFIAINCAAMPDNLLESELFGYEEGSFTGARKGGKLGLFEFAHNGSIFLDEVEGMSPALQIKLLRVIQEREIMRVGGNKIISIDVRIIASSNENLEDLVNKGVFRSDLYYRLNTLPVQIPPLRDRGEDIMFLFEELKKELKGQFNLSSEVKNAFLSHDWNGNVRELYNYVEYLAYLDKDYIEYEDLPVSFHKGLNIKYKMYEDTMDINLLKKISGNKFDDYCFVLEMLYKGYVKQTAMGRNSIADSAEASGRFLTQQEIRNILNDLSNLGLIKISRGRGGSKINDRGIKAYNNIKASI